MPLTTFIFIFWSFSSHFALGRYPNSPGRKIGNARFTSTPPPSFFPPPSSVVSSTPLITPPSLLRPHLPLIIPLILLFLVISPSPPLEPIPYRSHLCDFAVHVETIHRLPKEISDLLAIRNQLALASALHKVKLPGGVDVSDVVELAVPGPLQHV